MENPAETSPPSGSPVDLAAVAHLLADLERDLEAVRHGTQNLDALRAEVRALAAVLDRSAGDEAHVDSQLRSLHGQISGVREVAREDAFKAADYASRIGRMLGM